MAIKNDKPAITNTSHTQESKITQVSVGSPNGITFKLKNMPNNIEFFSADINSDFKLEIIKLSVTNNIDIVVSYTNNGNEMVEAEKIVLAVEEIGPIKSTDG